MRELLLSLTSDLYIIQIHSLLKRIAGLENFQNINLNYLADKYSEFLSVKNSIEYLEKNNVQNTSFTINFNTSRYGLITKYEKELQISLTKNKINEEVMYFAFIDNIEDVNFYIDLINEKERLYLESIYTLNLISKNVLEETFSKIAAKKNLELVAKLFQAKAAELRLYNRSVTELYASYGLPYGYVGRHTELPVNKVPLYMQIYDNKDIIFSEDVNNLFGFLYYELTEFINLVLVVSVPIIKKNEVIGVLSLLFENNNIIIKESLDILENIVNEFEFLLEKNEYYLQIINTTDRLKKLNLDIVTSLSDAIEARDTYTNGHSERVLMYSAEIARNMEWDDYELDRLCTAAILHDVGKVGIPDAVLLKPGPLNRYEFEIMKHHPELSANIVSKIESFQDIVPWIRYHHEFYDGSGYPYGLKGNEIPMGARIIAVADSFDAMTSDRPYRKALPMEKVYEIFKEGAGTQWDKDIVEIALKCLEVVPKDVKPASYSIPDKLDEFRKMIFNINLLSGLYLLEYLYEEAEKSIEQNNFFTIVNISLKDSIKDLPSREKKKIMDILIEDARNELHYPIMIARHNYYNIIIYCPMLNKNFIRSIIVKLQLEFYNKTEKYFNIKIFSYPEDIKDSVDLYEKVILNTKNS